MIDGILWQADADTLTFHRVDGAVADILGFTAAEWLARPDFWESRLHPDDAVWVVETCRRAARRRTPHRLVYRMVTRAGHTVWLKDAVTVTEHGDGATLHGVMLDVTDLVQSREAIEALNTEKAHFQTLYDLVPVAIWEEDWAGTLAQLRALHDDGLRDVHAHAAANPGFVDAMLAGLVVTDVNRAAVEIFGARDPAELIRRAPEVFRAGAPHSVFLTALQAILDGQRRIEGVNTLCRLDGAEVHVLYRISLPPLRDGPTRVVICEMDISATHRANERYALVCRATSDVIWDFDPVTDRIWASDGIARVFGLDPATRYTRLDDWTARLHPDERAAKHAALRAALDGTTTTWVQSYRFRHGDGSYRRVRDQGVIFRDDAGQATRMVGGMRDITDQHALEEQLQAAQRFEAIGKLTGGIAHDFNNLLTVVLGNLDLIEARLPDDPELRRGLEAANGAIDRCTALIGQLLTYARRHPVAPHTVDTAAVLARMTDIICQTLGDDIRVVPAAPPDDLPAGLFDPALFENAVLNLCLNARDAMPDGGTLTLALRRAGPDELGALPAGAYITLEVADTGHGMDAATADAAFEPFFSTKPRGEGSGLGLSMVQGFADQAGGAVRLRSAPGDGTRACVVLPASTTRAPDAAEAPLAGPAQPRAGHVLLLEDQQDVRASTAATLAQLGYAVTACATAAEATEALAGAAAFDIVLTDIRLPGRESGHDVARHAARLRPGVPVVLMSGFSDSAGAGNDPAQTGAQFLKKPFRRAELAQTLEAARALAAPGRPAAEDDSC